MVSTSMTVAVQNGTWELHLTPAEPGGARNRVHVEVRHKPRFHEPVVPWSGIRFELKEAEAYQIAQALIEATILDRDRSLKIVESFRSIAVKPAESTTPQHSPSNSGSKARFTQTQGRYLAFIHRYMSKYGVAPAEADIQRHFLVSAPSVNAMMQTSPAAD